MAVTDVSVAQGIPETDRAAAAPSGTRTTAMTERTIFFISILPEYFIPESSHAGRPGLVQVMQLLCHKHWK